jgi:hypothetical protein
MLERVVGVNGSLMINTPLHERSVLFVRPVPADKRSRIYQLVVGPLVELCLRQHGRFKGRMER